jgi:hypothetical protein
MDNSNSNRLIVWLVVILAIIVIILAGVFVYLKFFSQTETIDDDGIINPDSYQVPLEAGSTESPAQTKDPTANWLTFDVAKDDSVEVSADSDVDKIFSFKYPVGMEIQRNKNNLNLSINQSSSAQINVNWQMTSKSLDEYIDEIDKINATAWEGKPSIGVVTSTDKALVGTLPAVVREQRLLAADLSEYIVYFKTSSTIYSISVIAPQLDQNLAGLWALFVSNIRIFN